MSDRIPDLIGTESILHFTELLADSAESAPIATPVTTCGDWTLGDLVWHLTEVQDFWTYIINNRPADYTNYVQPDRPDNSQLTADLRSASTKLVESLNACEPSENAWSWSSEQTVGFSIRRQTHEALVHCIDGLLALNLDLPEVAPAVAADGVHEVLTVMLGAGDDPSGNDPANFVERTHALGLRATDTADSWEVEIGNYGKQLGIRFVEHPDPRTTITGTALELDLWLWGRLDLATLAITGDQANAQLLGSLVGTISD